MFKCSTSRSNWNLEVLVFVEGGKPEKNPRSKDRTNNKLNPHETASKGIELGSQRWDWGELLSTAPTVLPHSKSKREVVMDLYALLYMLFSLNTRTHSIDIHSNTNQQVNNYDSGSGVIRVKIRIQIMF